MISWTCPDCAVVLAIRHNEDAGDCPRCGRCWTGQDLAVRTVDRLQGLMQQEVRISCGGTLSGLLDDIHANRIKFLAQPIAWKCETAGGSISFTAAPSAGRRCTCSMREVCSICVDRVEAAAPRPVDPLDVEYDGVKLRDLLVFDDIGRREYATRFDGSTTGHRFTTAQRAAVSAHWSAELRAKVAAGKERERQQVVVDLEVD